MHQPAYLYRIDSDDFEALPVDFSALSGLSESSRIGLEIHAFHFSDEGSTLLLEVISYGDDRPNLLGIFDTASGLFTPLPITEFSALDFHLLDHERSQLIIVERHIRHEIKLQHYPYTS